jgi:hypothetical protein
MFIPWSVEESVKVQDASTHISGRASGDVEPNHIDRPRNDEQHLSCVLAV